MAFERLRDDDGAVSPVIGVILMVAITVILAAVIATFVLGLGESVSQNAPTASFGFDQSTKGGSPSIIVTHESGEALNPDNVDIVVAGTTYASDSIGASGQTGFGSQITDISAGDTANLTASSGDEIRIVWTSDDGSQSATLGSYTVE
ncbi:MAG: type IV pilin [Salinirussus sp.]